MSVTFPLILIWLSSNRSDNADNNKVLPLPELPIIAQNPPIFKCISVIKFIIITTEIENNHKPAIDPQILFNKILAGNFLVVIDKSAQVNTTGELSGIFGVELRKFVFLSREVLVFKT